jgi:predicted deacylase
MLAIVSSVSKGFITGRASAEPRSALSGEITVGELDYLNYRVRAHGRSATARGVLRETWARMRYQNVRVEDGELQLEGFSSPHGGTVSFVRTAGGAVDVVKEARVTLPHELGHDDLPIRGPGSEHSGGLTPVQRARIVSSIEPGLVVGLVHGRRCERGLQRDLAAGRWVEETSIRKYCAGLLREVPVPPRDEPDPTSAYGF